MHRNIAMEWNFAVRHESHLKPRVRGDLRPVPVRHSWSSDNDAPPLSHFQLLRTSHLQEN